PIHSREHCGTCHLLFWPASFRRLAAATRQNPLVDSSRDRIANVDVARTILITPPGPCAVLLSSLTLRFPARPHDLRAPSLPSVYCPALRKDLNLGGDHSHCGLVYFSPFQSADRRFSCAGWQRPYRTTNGDRAPSGNRRDTL